MSEASARTDSLGVCLHIPFCATRCGYCDFNMYMPGRLDSGTTQGDHLNAIVAELEMAVVKHPEFACGTGTAFVGGGTPLMLGVSGPRRLLDGMRSSFGLADDVEVTTESNPESTSSEFSEDLTETGSIRVSLGMQPAVLHVLTTLDRTHIPGRPAAAVAEARAAGFEHINLDVVYDTPGGSMADFDTMLEAVLIAEVDHVSAYSLVVEPDTAMACKVRRGKPPMPDDDDLVDRYERIDAALSQAGFSWYEVSNWAKPGGQCRHNMIYRCDGNWWDAGPGAHSHLNDTRSYNAKHPARYAAIIFGGELPIKDLEKLTAEDRHTEKIVLGFRLTEGIDANLLGEDELGKARQQAEAGMVEFISVDDGQRTQPTNRGRLPTDTTAVDIFS